MKLNEYIKRNYETPNPAILRSLGANEELISYLLYTKWNTNINIISSIGNKNKKIQLQLIGKQKSRYDSEEDRDYYWYEGSINLKEPLPTSGKTVFTVKGGGTEEIIEDDPFLELGSCFVVFFDVTLNSDRKEIHIDSLEDETPGPSEVIIDIEITV